MCFGIFKDRLTCCQSELECIVLRSGGPEKPEYDMDARPSDTPSKIVNTQYVNNANKKVCSYCVGIIYYSMLAIILSTPVFHGLDSTTFIPNFPQVSTSQSPYSILISALKCCNSPPSLVR